MKLNENLIQILLVDDDADDRDFFEEALQDSGIPSNLTTVIDGEKLTDFLAEIENPPPPDIIFMDINMPYKDGKTCLREIRKDRKFREVPIIMFSTSTHTRDIEESFNCGANLYLSKGAFFENDVHILKQIFGTNWRENILNVKRDQFFFKA